MAIATGVNKQLIIKKESSFGVFAGPTGGQLLRRVTSGLNMTKSTIKSNEIASHFQVASSRHGVRKVEGPISGELSGGSYQTLFEAALRAAAPGALTTAPATYAVGDRVRVKGTPHMPGQSTGTVTLVNGTAYGIVFDGMEKMGTHRWYAVDELVPAA